MKGLKPKYSLRDPMVVILCCLLVFVTFGTLFSGCGGSKRIYRVELDAAFGGTNKGFTGYVPEADINEKTVNAIEALLTKDERFEVIRTHAAGTDAAVLDTAAKITEDAPELVLSIHGGWDPDESLSGTRIYTNLPGRKGSGDAKKFAKTVCDAFSGENWHAELDYLYYHEEFNGTYTVEVTDAAGEQPVFAEGETPVTWTLLENTEIPCVIVEQFFVSNKSDIARWDSADGYKEIAEKYYTALCSYFSIEEMTFEEEAPEGN